MEEETRSSALVGFFPRSMEESVVIVFSVSAARMELAAISYTHSNAIDIRNVQLI